MARETKVSCDRCGQVMDDADQANGLVLAMVGAGTMIDLHRHCADQLRDWLNQHHADPDDTVDP